MPLRPIATAANTPAFLFFDIARAVPIPWLANPKANPLAAMSFTLNKSRTKAPSAVPTIPVSIVMIAVNEGIPPISSDIPIAIGAVTLRGSKDFVVSGSNFKP